MSRKILMPDDVLAESRAELTLTQEQARTDFERHLMEKEQSPLPPRLPFKVLAPDLLDRVRAFVKDVDHTSDRYLPATHMLLPLSMVPDDAPMRWTVKDENGRDVEHHGTVAEYRVYLEQHPELQDDMDDDHDEWDE